VYFSLTQKHIFILGVIFLFNQLKIILLKRKKELCNDLWLDDNIKLYYNVNTLKLNLLLNINYIFFYLFSFFRSIGYSHILMLNLNGEYQKGCDVPIWNN